MMAFGCIADLRLLLVFNLLSELKQLGKLHFSKLNLTKIECPNYYQLVEVTLQFPVERRLYFGEKMLLCMSGFTLYALILLKFAG
jgi:hypothetical protein